MASKMAQRCPFLDKSNYIIWNKPKGIFASPKRFLIILVLSEFLSFLDESPSFLQPLLFRSFCWEKLIRCFLNPSSDITICLIRIPPERERFALVRQYLEYAKWYPFPVSWANDGRDHPRLFGFPSFQGAFHFTTASI